MKTEWNYTSLADAYLKRPDYSDSAIDAMLKIAEVSKGASICGRRSGGCPSYSNAGGKRYGGRCCGT